MLSEKGDLYLGSLATKKIILKSANKPQIYLTAQFDYEEEGIGTLYFFSFRKIGKEALKLITIEIFISSNIRQLN